MDVNTIVAMDRLLGVALITIASLRTSGPDYWTYGHFIDRFEDVHDRLYGRFPNEEESDEILRPLWKSFEEADSSELVCSR